MLLRAFAVALAVTVVTPAPGPAGAAGITAPAVAAVAAPAAGTAVESVPDGSGEPPPVTFNEFLPEDRGLGECISALPRPGCGSEARGGWRQGLVLLAIVVGLTIIGWRIVAGARRARVTTPRTPGATTAPDGRGDGPGS